MIRGTTPTHTFKMPFSPENIKDIIVTYAQRGKVIFEKRTDECSFTDDSVIVRLTQEETFLFPSSDDVYIQLRVLLQDGSALASCKYSVPLFDVLNDEVMT